MRHRSSARVACRACLAAAGLEERGRDGIAMQRQSPGHPFRDPRTFQPTSSASGRRSASLRCRAAAPPGSRWRRPTAVEPIEFAPKRAVAPQTAAQPRRAAAAAGRDRCGSAAASATGYTGRFALRGPARRSRRNIWPRSRPRSTSAKSRPGDGFDMVLGHNRATALRRARPRRAIDLAARPMERERPQRMDRRRQRQSARRRSRAA